MTKRFIDTNIWTQNKWYRKLKPEYKLLWIYLLTNCDSVGVWEEDLELASFIIGYEYSIDSLKEFGDRLHKMSNKKYWIVDFCNFQYGVLEEENIKNRPHQSYIQQLKKHSLWIVYKKTIHRDKEKDIYKDSIDNSNKDTTKYKYNKFYDTELERKDVSENYKMFIEYLFGNNATKRPFQKILKMEDQISYENFIKIMDAYPASVIKEKIEAMENRPKLNSQNTSFYLTLNNWCKRELKK